MKAILKVLLAFFAACIIYTCILYHPVIIASFDEAKYVDGEVFTPVGGEFDFRKFTILSPQSKNFTAYLQKCGYVQFVDKDNLYTVNIFEWDKMTHPSRDRLNSSFMLEFEKPNRTVEGICVLEMDYLTDRFYSACVDDPNSNNQVYVAAPTVNETVELARSVKFKGAE